MTVAVELLSVTVFRPLTHTGPIPLRFVNEVVKAQPPQLLKAVAVLAASVMTHPNGSCSVLVIVHAEEVADVAQTASVVVELTTGVAVGQN